MQKEEGDSKGKSMVDDHASLIDVQGRNHLYQTLSTHANPGQAFVELQETFGLKYSSSIALPFLDLLEVSRASVYQNLFESSKNRLDDALQKISDEPKLLEMLSATFRFITVKDLKSIPIGVIKRLRTVPERYLKVLSSKKFHGIIEVGLIHLLLTRSPTHKIPAGNSTVSPKAGVAGGTITFHQTCD
jgi:hypothetical protein